MPDVTTQNNSIDWNTILTNLEDNVSSIITAVRQPAGSATGTLSVTRSGVSGSVSPLLILVVGAVLVAFILKK